MNCICCSRSAGFALCLGLLHVLNASPVVKACLNEYEPRPSEETRDQQGFQQYQLTTRSADDYLAALTAGATEHAVSDEKLDDLEIAAAQGDFRDRTNYAVALCRRGQALRALELLLQAEAEQPGEYIVAANLGTAYELTGNNAEALRWILAGIERNAKSHEGTEWLHVKILEAKLKLAADSDWLAAHSVLGLNFGSDEQPATPAGHVTDQFGLAKTIAEVQIAIEYQLHERLGLVAAPDAIVASLLADLGNLLALGHAPHKAARVYALAVEYARRTPHWSSSGCPMWNVPESIGLARRRLSECC